MEPKKPGRREPGAAWRYDALGYSFAGTIVLSAGLGYLLDRWLGFAPLFTIVLTLSGAALACGWVYSKVRQDDRAAEERRHGDGPGPE